MPRKKALQPEPLKRFYLPDGTEVDIVDRFSWPIGSGQHSARDFEYDRMLPITEDLVKIYLKPNGAVKVDQILSSSKNFVDYITLLGLLGEDGADDTNARKYWFKRVKKRFSTYINALNEAHKKNQ